MNDDKTHLNQVDIAEICEYARLVRRKIVEITHQGGATHVGSALSCTDILAAAYWGVMVVDPENPTAPEPRFVGFYASLYKYTLCPTSIYIKLQRHILYRKFYFCKSLFAFSGFCF